MRHARSRASEARVTPAAPAAATYARVDIVVGDTQVVVTTSARVAGPGGLLGSLPGVTVSADAVALVEEP